MIFHYFIVLAFVFLLSQTCFAQANNDLAWPPTTRQTRPWTRWWWPGNAVDPKNLTRELEQLNQAGIGGVEITPIYGIVGAESRDIDFLSPKWMEMLKHVGAEAKRLDMGVDMATCTGWPYGGPMVTAEMVDEVVTRDGDKLVSKPSGMKVKRAAPGGAGNVLNPYSVKGIEIYLKAFDSLPRSTVRAQFHDSFEYSGNWTHELIDRFKADRGYDLREHVKELFGEGDPETVARVKSDYRETLAAMHLSYIEAWAKWCHTRGELARNQAHGAPGNLLDLYAAADIPETETFGSTPFTIPGFRRIAEDTDGKNEPSPMISKFASSAAHVSGKPLASSETLTWLREHFKVSLAMAKPEVDQMLLAGINHIFYHGTCYSPDDAAWPGWLFYASSEINLRDTIWHDLPEMNAYIARCQSILQSGSPDNDVLVYWPVYDNWDSAEGLEQRFTVHAVAQWLMGTPFAQTSKQLTELGYGHDFISDRQLLECTSTEGGGIKTGAGATYRALVLPPTHKIPAATLERIAKLVQGGAYLLVCGDALPEDVPGFGRLDERRAQLGKVRARLSTEEALAANGVRVAPVGKGNVLRGQPVADLLNMAGVKPETFVGEGVGFIRRRRGDGGHDYFIASQGTRAIDGWVPLSVPCEGAVLMDPVTGKAGVAATRKVGSNTEVYLQLAPGQSIIVRTLPRPMAQAPGWSYVQPAGEPVDLSGPWQVEFISGAPKLPAGFKADKLGSWTELATDPEAQRFAGTARYRIEFDRPPQISGPCLLDLGDLRESARVRLNGKEVGAVWSLPFQIRLEDLKDRENVLEIDVTNLSANRVRDLDQRAVKWRIMKEINYVNIHYKPFDASVWELAPSGLLGPVRLVPMRELKPQ